MSDVDDLVTWLRAQLDDDERALTEYDEFFRGLPVTTIAIPPGTLLGEPLDPVRQRREVDAKRRILDWAIEFMEGDYAPWNEDCIKLLALPYADRPGYRDEWRP